MMSVKISRYRRVVFFTGAGMSAECGVPTYRGEGGIWGSYRYQDYACQEAFERDPEQVWEFHDKRRAQAAGCQPHAGHQLIAEWEQLMPGVQVVTQNIDGMHQRAGVTRIHELHGSMWRLRCDPCGIVEEHLEVPLDNHRHACGRFWRPDIVWFGDCLNRDVLAGARQAIRTCELLVVVGTSGVVYPAAQLAVEARSFGALVVEINPQATNLTTSCDLSLRGTAAEMLTQL